MIKIDEELLALSKSRHNKGEIIYGDTWKTKSNKDLIVDIKEEMADIVNYLNYIFHHLKQLEEKLKKIKEDKEK